MPRVAQFGIALGALGIVLTLMGLFPGVTGMEPTRGIGITQTSAILIGFLLLILGALIYVKFTFYVYKPANLAQQIGVRLALTGLLFAAMSGYADMLGFGSHERTATTDIFLGNLQAIGLIGSFAIASLGVLVYAITGELRADTIADPPSDGAGSKDLTNSQET
ncbi:MAG: hypothetical protein HZC41_02915 [Chloroflexi bacterium]|nr:hypothetical protein [Chloroflexota bacterium]